MRTRLIPVAVVALCALVVFVAAQTQPTTGPSAGSGDVCPPSGDNMGQSNYQRAPHHPQAAQQPVTAPPKPESPAPEMVTPPPTEIETLPEFDATSAERQNITVDDKYVYVLQGDEVVKLDKSDLHEVARTKLPEPSSP
jgi:hypothetical protein